MDNEKKSLSFGNYLKTVRLEKEIRLEDIAEKTRIRIQILNYIENEELDNLPEEVFVKGFLRAYAKVVGADGDEAVKLYLSALYSETEKEESEAEGAVQNTEKEESEAEGSVQNPALPDTSKEFKTETKYIKTESDNKAVTDAKSEEKIYPKNEPEKKEKRDAGGDKGKKSSENKVKKESENRGKKKERSQTESDKGTENKNRNKFLFYLIIMGILSCVITLAVYLIFTFQSQDTDDGRSNPPVTDENRDAPVSETPAIPDSSGYTGSGQNNENQMSSSEKKNDSSAQGTSEQSGSQKISGGEVGSSSLRLEPTVTTLPGQESVVQNVITPESLKTEDVSAGSQEASAGKLVLKINAVEKTWMRVVIDGKNTKDYILNPGDNREVEALSDFQLTIGNVKGVNLMLNDAPVALSGERGSGGVLKMKIP